MPSTSTRTAPSPGPALPGAPAPALLDALRAAVGDAHVLTGADVRARATHFWDAAPLAAGALVRPRTTHEVAAVLKACHAHRQSVVTHGGVTGLAEGDRATIGIDPARASLFDVGTEARL